MRADLEKIVTPDCVLATNTSSLSPTAIAAGLSHPGRLVAGKIPGTTPGGGGDRTVLLLCGRVHGYEGYPPSEVGFGVRVAAAGTFLAFEHGLTDTFDAALEDAELLTLLSELARETGPAEAFELLCHRFFEAHSRRLSTTPEPIAELMVRLTGHAGTVLDPACGVGSLVLAGGADQVLAQDSDPATARIAALRLALRGIPAEVHAVDALREDAFAGRTADVVLCDPPFNERAWGHDELVGDDRWEYGLPPRGEPATPLNGLARRQSPAGDALLVLAPRLAVPPSRRG